MSLIGVVDTLWDTCISGWAADDADFETTVAVDVLVNALMVATVPCATSAKICVRRASATAVKVFASIPAPI